MNVDELLREVMREQAAEQSPPVPNLADRVLTARRRRRTRRLASVAAATCAVVAIAVAVPQLDSGKEQTSPAHVLDGSGIAAHPQQSPPRDLIAAGNTALASYYTTKTVVKSETRAVAKRTYMLLNPKTGRYEKDTRWSYVAVAPGLRTAAVLERELPAHRIGLLDLATGKVERWIPVDRGVGGVAFSRDGSRLVATTYGENPDTLVGEKGTDGSTGWVSRFHDSSRSGFYVLDVSSGKGSWSGVTPGRDINGRQDFSFSRTGEQVYSQVIGSRDGLQQFYDLDGGRIAAPAEEKYLRSDVGARLSPDGRLAALGLTKEVPPGKSYSSIRDPRTGKEITKVRGAELLAWADGHRLIAWERVTSLEEPYRDRLVLVTIGSDKIVPLSGVREPYEGGRAWVPVFAQR